jgi:hypothetical protein
LILKLDEFNQNLKSENIEYKLVHKETSILILKKSKSTNCYITDSNDNEIQKNNTGME